MQVRIQDFNLDQADTLEGVTVRTLKGL